MKNPVSNLIKTSLAVAIVTAFAACSQSKTDSKPTTTSTTTAVTGKQDIVYVNSDSLLNKYDYYKDMTKRLQDKGKAANDDVTSKKQAFQREVGDYQKSAQTMSADERATTEQRLQKKGQEMQAYEQNATAQFQSDNAAEQSKLYDRIADFTKTYAKEKGYKLVLTYSKASPTVLFGDPSLDVTEDVVKRLNDLYSKDKK